MSRTFIEPKASFAYLSVISYTRTVLSLRPAVRSDAIHLSAHSSKRIVLDNPKLAAGDVTTPSVERALCFLAVVADGFANRACPPGA